MQRVCSGKNCGKEGCQTCGAREEWEEAYDEMYGGDYEEGPSRSFGERKREHASSIEEFGQQVKKMKRSANDSSFKQIDVYNLERTLFEALIFPELSKGVKLPSQFQIPTYTFQQKNSFTISTNAAGNCLVQINMGQFLESSMFYTGDGDNGANGPRLVSGAASTNPPIGGVTIGQNGSSFQGVSNVFVCNDSSLNGTTPVISAGGTYKASNVMAINAGTFNAVRAGPMSVKYEYIGRLDISSGNVTAGVNYTTVSDPSVNDLAAKGLNGLMPDPSYSILSALEDCPFSRTVPITDSLKGIFIPQDYTLLNLKNPKDANATNMPQRMYFLVLAGPPNQTVARITITSNWEAIPTRSYSDIISLSYNTFPADFDGKSIYEFMIANNLVITKDDSEFGMYRFNKNLNK